METTIRNQELIIPHFEKMGMEGTYSKRIEYYDNLDKKVLGFKTTERLEGDWISLLFEIRNYKDIKLINIGKKKIDF